jgi:hypothetical protein
MDLIQQLVGKKVTVYSAQGETERQDIGILEAAEGVWLKMHKENGEVLYFHLARIRVVKPF